MLETYYSSGKKINKALVYFPSIKVTDIEYPKNRTRKAIGNRFYFLSKQNKFRKRFKDIQLESGYEDDYGIYILYKYETEKEIDFYDDPMQKFIGFAVSFSLSNQHKLYPQVFSVINDSENKDNFYKPRNYLSREDYNTIASEKDFVITNQDFKKSISKYKKINKILKSDERSKINEALNFYKNYLETDDPKFRLLLLTMILEALFVEDQNAYDLQTRLKIRISRFLYEDKEEVRDRERICDFLKILYRLRSETVHGSEYQKRVEKRAKKESISVNKFIDNHIEKADKLVREVVIKILESRKAMAVMSQYPRDTNPARKKLKKFYRKLELG